VINDPATCRHCTHYTVQRDACCLCGAEHPKASFKDKPVPGDSTDNPQPQKRGRPRGNVST
jgi:hypothetical protein